MYLSEGEKNLITFLYFFYNAQEKIEDDNAICIVIDDPVTSIDHQSMGLVATLTNYLFKMCYKKDPSQGKQQCFVFTHNAYFAHEIVRFNNGNPKERTRCFVIKKSKHDSAIQPNSPYPFKSVYQKMWEDSLSDSLSNRYRLNAMRRILEHYFTYIGNTQLSTLDQIDDESQPAYAAIIKALHFGSHKIDDPVDLTLDDADFAIYVDGFREIFKINGQECHFNHMEKSISPS